ncbi:MAG: glutamate synthase subunit beta [Clostridia bacterium]|nr:glutamate synthase subunit beta [Clostridia bacterium]
MGKATGFMEYDRKTAQERKPDQRISDWDAFHPVLSEEEAKVQAARCMNCGIPFCHGGVNWKGVASGCPLGNLIPEWNDLVYRAQYEEAWKRLSRTSPFPEFTSRVCPALCEGACTTGLHNGAVTVKEIERFITDMAWEKSWIQPNPPKERNGKTAAVIGSGPAGLAAAWKLNRLGVTVTVFEKSELPGGLLTFGIPNMKLPKEVVARRVKFLEDEGITFVTNTDVGKDLKVEELKKFDTVVLCGGAGQPRDLTVEGRTLEGVRFAVPYLTEATKRVLSGDTESKPLQGKNVVIIGGGDTGNDCVATTIREGAASVKLLEIMAALPSERANDNPWPRWPFVLKTDYGHQEAIYLFGHDPRSYLTTTASFIGENGHVTAIETMEVEWVTENGRRIPKPKAETKKVYPADLVLIAMGFAGAETYLPEALGISFGKTHATDKPGVFAAGDMRTGQSLVVRAMRDGMDAALEAAKYLGLE